MVMVAVCFCRVLPKPYAAQPLALLRPSSPISRSLVPVNSLPTPSLLSFSTVRSRRFRQLCVQESGASETFEEARDAGQEDSTTEDVKEDDASSSVASVSASTASVADELKEMMEARRKEASSNLLKGVLEEVREIEWPSFGKVLGTTGIVLAVIVGSSVALLTINAVLAELSDKVFAGRGIQDFF